MLHRIACIFVSCLLIAGCGESNPEAEAAGAAAVEQWLAVVDNGDYAESWTASAKFFQSKVSQDDWTQMVAGAREPFGSFQTRSLSKTQYATSLPGVPDGEYVICIFEASFDKKVEAIETVTAMKEGSEWRVAGYFIR